MSNESSKIGRATVTEVNEASSVSRRQFLRTTALIAGGALAGRAVAAGTQHGGHDMGHGASAAAPAAAPTMDHAAMGHGASDYGSMMFMKDHRMPTGLVIEPPGSPADHEVDYKVFDIDVRIIQHEILPGVKVHMFAFNGTVPGPGFNVTEGDWIKVNFLNNTEEMHTIHWHGVNVPYTMDGVPMLNQDPVHPGHTFVYRFQAKPAGTHWYHCHWGTPLHMGHGMHGPFIIQRKHEHLKEQYPYTREYTLMLEAWDSNFAREEINGLLEGMKQVNALMDQGRLDPMTHGFFRDYDEFVAAYKSGKYIPPYLQGRSSGIPIKPDFFGINGKAHPATEALRIKPGEWIRVRLINASGESYHLHLHGHDFFWVAQDGHDLPLPQKLNTVHVEPGGTYDIMIHGDNPGYWAFHDHKGSHARNNGIYPGGVVTMLAYEDFEPTYRPAVSVDQ